MADLNVLIAIHTDDCKMAEAAALAIGGKSHDLYEIFAAVTKMLYPKDIVNPLAVATALKNVGPKDAHHGYLTDPLPAVVHGLFTESDVAFLRRRKYLIVDAYSGPVEWRADASAKGTYRAERLEDILRTAVEAARSGGE